MIKGVTNTHLGPIWYHSEPSDVPYSPNQFLGWNFFAVSYSKLALVATVSRLVCYNFEIGHASTGVSACVFLCLENLVIYSWYVFWYVEVPNAFLSTTLRSLIQGEALLKG